MVFVFVSVFGVFQSFTRESSEGGESNDGILCWIENILEPYKKEPYISK